MIAAYWRLARMKAIGAATGMLPQTRRVRLWRMRWSARQAWGTWAPREPEAILRLSLRDGIVTAADVQTILAAGGIDTTTEGTA